MGMIRLFIAACLIAAAPVAGAQELNQRQREQFLGLYSEAWALADPYIVLDGVAKNPPNLDKLLEALSRTESGLALQPENWPLWWLQGKIYQVMNDHSQAYVSLMRAYEIQPHEIDVINEMTIEAMRAGKYELAHKATTIGLSEFPNSLALRARLATVYLASGNADDSIKAGEYALKLAPDDKVTKAIIALAGDLKAGRVTLVKVRETLKK